MHGVQQGVNVNSFTFSESCYMVVPTGVDFMAGNKFAWHMLRVAL